jgi:MYXO-CTERM domain-containing protein
VIVVVVGGLILSATQARMVSASEGQGSIATPLPRTSIALAAASPRLGTPTSIVKFEGGGAVAAQTAGFAATAGLGQDACVSGACADRTAHQIGVESAAPRPPYHMLLLAAVGAVAFMARRRRVWD